MGPAPSLVVNAWSLSMMEMDQVSANLSKQDMGHPRHTKSIFAKSNRDKVTRRQPADGNYGGGALN
jgi:hypothetical protein